MHRWTAVLLSLVLVWLFPVGQAQAYKPRVHVIMTQMAFARYHECREVRGLRPTSFDPHRIEQGVRREDHPTFERALNWHFWEDDGRLSWWINPLKRGMTRVFRRKTRRLDRRMRNYNPSLKGRTKRFARAVGRSLHYIQDVSAPAHVVPVYHAKGNPFDAYDPMRLRVQIEAALGPVTPRWCDQVEALAKLRGHDSGPQALLESNATSTLARLDEDPTTSKHLWLRKDEVDTQEKQCKHGVRGDGKQRRADNKYRSGDKAKHCFKFGCYGSCEFGSDSCQAVPRRTMDELYIDLFVNGVRHSISLMMYAEPDSRHEEVSMW